MKKMALFSFIVTIMFLSSFLVIANVSRVNANTSVYPSTWTNITPSTSPPARANHMMAYDSENDVAVLFGGWNGSYLGDTWIYSFQNNTWMNKSPVESPSPRESGGMVYATKHNEVILFGGYNGSSTLNETWIYKIEENNWTQLFPAVVPPSTMALTNLGMAYDSKDDIIVMFSDEGNTWTYNITLNSWRNMNPYISPNPRALSTNGQQMVYDESHNAVLLFGGSPVWLSTAMNDTWTYDYEANTWTNMAPYLAPASRENSQMAYDRVNNVIVLYGGANGNQTFLYNDTWIYNMTSNQWINVTILQTPPVRFGSAMIFSPVHDEIILFGGYDLHTIYSDTWAFTYIPSPLPPSPILTLTCFSSSYSNFNVEIRGNLTINGTELFGAPIVLAYSIDGGNSWQGLTLVNTTSNGDFSAEWRPSVTGNFMIKATWEGNATYHGVSTSVNLVIEPFTVDNVQNVFSVSSNSAISNLMFDSASEKLTFTVSGLSGTTGYADVSISKGLFQDISDLKVSIDEKEITYTSTSDGNYWILHFYYKHSTHNVMISIDLWHQSISTGLAIFIGSIPVIAMISVFALFFKRKRAIINPYKVA